MIELLAHGGGLSEIHHLPEIIYGVLVAIPVLGVWVARLRKKDENNDD